MAKLNGKEILFSPKVNLIGGIKREAFTDGATIAAQDNTVYIAENPINSVAITYPDTAFICSFIFTLAAEGDVTVTLPASQYIGKTPTFANGETWELSIHNGIVAGGKAE